MTAAATSFSRSCAAARIFSSSPAIRCAWRDDGREIALEVRVGIAALEQIAVADDRLQRAVDLGRDRQRQLRHRFHRPVLAERDLQLLRDDGDREDLGDRHQDVDVLLLERVRSAVTRR